MFAGASLLKGAVAAAMMLALAGVAMQWGPRAVRIGSGPFAGWEGVVQDGQARLGWLDNRPQIIAPGAGRNFAQWSSPAGWLATRPGVVWRVRARVESDQHEAGRTPLWGLLLGERGRRPACGGTYLFLDNAGGANSAGLAGSVGRGEFEAWFTPPAALNESAGRAGGRAGLSVAFQLADNAEAGIDARQDAGTLGLREIELTSYSLGSMAMEQEVYELGRMTPERVAVDSIPGSVGVSFSGGALTLALTGQGLAAFPRRGYYDPTAPTLAAVQPGGPESDGAAARRRNWPIPWEANKLYLIEAEMSARAPLGDDSPLRVRIGMDSATTELIALAWSGSGGGLPQPGAPQRFIAFFHSHNRTLADDASWQGLRPRVSLDLEAGAKATAVAGSAVTLHGLRVYKVRFPDQDR
jgi:hypothetical protein